MFSLQSISPFKNDYPNAEIMAKLMERENKKMSLTCPVTGQTAYFIENTSSGSSLQNHFKFFQFEKTSIKEAVDTRLPKKQQQILSFLVNIFDSNIQGLYDKVFKDIHKNNIGLMEVDPLLNPIQRKYFTNKGGLIEKMKILLLDCSDEEIDFIFNNLMGIEKEIINTDVSLNFTQIFLKFKEKPEAHMLPDVNYRKGVMTSKGIRPDTKRFPIATTKQLMCHGVFAMMVDTLKE
ncbi:MAG: hypothetical protein RLZZ210_228 [Pseudomonadota bacterium]|jgi:hypothetical protein